MGNFERVRPPAQRSRTQHLVSLGHRSRVHHYPRRHRLQQEDSATSTTTLRAEQTSGSLRGVPVQLVNAMCVQVESDRDPRVTEPLRHNLRRHTSLKRQRRPRVPQIMEPNPWKPRPPNHPPEAPRHVRRRQRRPVRFAVHPRCGFASPACSCRGPSLLERFECAAERQREVRFSDNHDYRTVIEISHHEEGQAL